MNWYVGGSAAQSGAIADLRSTTVQTTVLGPGMLRFRWKVSSETGYDWLYFHFDSWPQLGISGEFAWEEQSWFVPEGTHILTWTYSKDETASVGADAAWLDAVSFESGTNFAPGLKVPAAGPAVGPVLRTSGPVRPK